MVYKKHHRQAIPPLKKLTNPWSCLQNIHKYQSTFIVYTSFISHTEKVIPHVQVSITAGQSHMPKVWNSVLLSYLWFIDFSLGFFVNIYSLEFTSHTLRSEAVEWITLMKPALTVAFQQTRWGLPAFTSLSLFSLCGRWHPAYVSQRGSSLSSAFFIHN